ncbi:TRAP transporter small permease [Orrella sp. JC864]|uniref:TRAP transporter small permease subunit n=1 Tax=Orrella sp. JC864 TaxID=3120298 RepID=UPI00300A6D92
MTQDTLIARTLRAAANLTGMVALAFLLFMMLGTTVDAAARLAAGRPIAGVFEISELAMVMVVFMGLGWTQADQAHIRVTLLKDRLPPRAARMLDALAWLLAAVLLAVLAYPATGEAIESVAIREFRWGYVEVPIWWAKLAVAAGLWFGALQMLACAAAALCRPAPPPEAGARAAAH